MIDLKGLEYKPYQNKEIIKDTAKLLILTEDRVKEIHNEWQEIEKHNKEVKEKRVEMYDSIKKEIADVLQKHNVNICKSVKYSSLRKENIKTYYDWYVKNILTPIKVKVVPHAEIDKPTIYNYKDIVDMYKTLEKQSGYHKQKMEKEHKLLEASLKYIKEYDVDVEGMTDVIEWVDCIAKNKWLYENHKDGDVIYIKCCSECDEWEFESHRCSCGNRRISANVEGDLVEGFWLNVEAY